MLSRAHVIFGGKVQGVFFRANTRKKAFEYGIKGWVRNLSDGRVEAVFEGKKEDVERLIEWCRYHQPYAVVDDIKMEWEKPEGLRVFEIRH